MPAMLRAAAMADCKMLPLPLLLLLLVVTLAVLVLLAAAVSLLGGCRRLAVGSQEGSMI